MKLLWKFALLGMLAPSLFVDSKKKLIPVSLQREKAENFRVLVLYENGGHHKAFTDAAIPWLNKLARDSGFQIDYLQHVDSINLPMLSKYKLFFQLDYVPYGWSNQAKEALIQCLKQGGTGWLGLHHASLLGNFDGFPIWPWFDQFMGGIHFQNYIPGFADGMVKLEKPRHPIFAGVPLQFLISKEEWYTYDKPPEAPVTVLASVDENSYHPPSAVRMGYHPVIWSNTKLPARNVYIFMGHSPDLLLDTLYCKLLRNSIFWAAGKK